MTKKQLRKAYEEWNIEVTKKVGKQVEIFKELQNMSAEFGDGNRWCSITRLIQSILTSTEEYQVNRAMNLVEEYYSIDGQFTALRDFCLATDNFNIGKEQ